jgi:hypothetical protein
MSSSLSRVDAGSWNADTGVTTRARGVLIDVTLAVEPRASDGELRALSVFDITWKLERRLVRASGFATCSL